MIYLFENPGNGASIVYDGSTLTEEQKARGVAVEALPEPQTPTGKIAVLKVRKSTGDVWYDYVNKPQSELEQQLAALQQENLMALEAAATLYEMLIAGGEPQ